MYRIDALLFVLKMSENVQVRLSEVFRMPPPIVAQTQFDERLRHQHLPATQHTAPSLVCRRTRTA